MFHFRFKCYLKIQFSHFTHLNSHFKHLKFKFYTLQPHFLIFLFLHLNHLQLKILNPIQSKINQLNLFHSSIQSEFISQAPFPFVTHLRL